MPLQTRSPGFRLSALSTTQEKKGLFPPALEFTWLRCSAATAQQQPRLARERGELPVRTRLLPASLLWSSPGIPLGRSPCRLPTGSPSAQPEVSGKTQRLKSKRTNFSLFCCSGLCTSSPGAAQGSPQKAAVIFLLAPIPTPTSVPLSVTLPWTPAHPAHYLSPLGIRNKPGGSRSFL